MPESPMPSVSSFLIADQVFQQAGGKWCIIGVFDRIRARRYPLLHSSLGLFVVLSDAKGQYDVKVELRNSRDQILGLMQGIRLTVPDRLAHIGFGLQTKALVIPAPGKYFFKLYLDGKLVPTDLPLDAVLSEGQS